MTDTIYTPDQISVHLKNHPDWSLGEDGQLHVEWTFKDFKSVLLFTNAVGLLAEAADHHPDLFIHRYKRLKISLMTHSAGGITDKDFTLITAIEALPRS
jgi:4a-hydroxytetrahydrobiopterin dehydratase